MINKPPDDLRGNWSAELHGAETWRDIDLHDTWWDAGIALIEDEQCWDSPKETLPDYTKIDVGIMRPPKAPEEFVSGYDVLDRMTEGDYDYDLDCAEGWLAKTPNGTMDDLTSMLRAVVGQWLDKYDLRPKWFVVGKRWTVTAGDIRAKAQEMQT